MDPMINCILKLQTQFVRSDDVNFCSDNRFNRGHIKFSSKINSTVQNSLIYVSKISRKRNFEELEIEIQTNGIQNQKRIRVEA
ncbi:unnamed protein product [Rhizophagus irregularis]|nr:unnamed protein product [Rhizophagus irregularis]